MLNIQSFVFGPFYENTYLLWDETNSCVVVDPGCYDREERETLVKFIEDNALRVEKVWNTHCHIDHIFGNQYLLKKFGVPLLAHHAELDNLRGAPAYSRLFGVQIDPSPEPDEFVEEGQEIGFGNSRFKVLFVPGHSPGHLAFFHEESRQLLSGDVLFQGSIGRTDLPGGNMGVLMKSIVEKVLPLGDDVVVLSGHGPKTSIGVEKRHNPYVLNYSRSL